MRPVRFLTRAVAVTAGLALAAPLAATGGLPSLTADDLRRWVTDLASDEFQGRATYTAGLGLATGYIQEHLRDWGVTPAGDAGTYIQTVRVLGVKRTSRSSVTVHVGGRTRTFKDGEGVTFSPNQGISRSLTVDRVEFAGYGLDAPGAGHMDFAGKDVRGAAVVWLGNTGPSGLDEQPYRRLLNGRSRYATEQLGALASLGPPASSATPAPDPGNASSGSVDFTTAERLDHVLPPGVRASDELLTFLFSRAPASYADLQRQAAAGEGLPSFLLEGVRLVFTIDVDYDVVRTELTQNIVGIVEGRDPALASTYVAFGAHYDHVGYASEEASSDGRRPAAPGRVTNGAAEDRVWNGADDNASGTAAIMGLARAFAEGPRPRRSLLFVWHAGEERGLLGSRYFVDHPTVPLDRIVAHFNADMIGRNRDDLDSEADTVYLVGSDRISTELHEISREANRVLPDPLTLDYAMNDPADPEQLYFRSDHYSYASRGIPVIFFTTGLHPDYHANTDHASKIEFEKMTRITRLLYETGVRVANLERPPVRDHRGPRAGKGTPE